MVSDKLFPRSFLVSDVVAKVMLFFLRRVIDWIESDVVSANPDKRYANAA